MQDSIHGQVKFLLTLIIVGFVFYLAFSGVQAYEIHNAEQREVNVTVVDKYRSESRRPSILVGKVLVPGSGSKTDYIITVTDGVNKFNISTSQSLFEQAMLGGIYRAKVWYYKETEVVRAILLTD